MSVAPAGDVTVARGGREGKPVLQVSSLSYQERHFETNFDTCDCISCGGCLAVACLGPSQLVVHL